MRSSLDSLRGRGRALTTLPAVLMLLLVVVNAPAQMQMSRRVLPAEEATPTEKKLMTQLTNNPTDAAAWEQLGLLQMELQRTPTEILAALNKSNELRPDKPTVLAALARVYTLADRSLMAEEIATRLLAVDPNSAAGRRYLAAAQYRQGRPREALANAEAAVKLDPRGEETRFYRALILLALSGTNSAAAQQALQEFMTAFPNSPETPTFQEQLASLQRLESNKAKQSASGRADGPYRSQEVTQKAIFKSWPDPGYPESARRAGAVGSVRLRVVLAKDGTVQSPIILRGLGYGLNALALSTIRQVRFDPALKDGRPVAQYAIAEYVFELY